MTSGDRTNIGVRRIDKDRDVVTSVLWKRILTTEGGMFTTLDSGSLYLYLPFHGGRETCRGSSLLVSETGSKGSRPLPETRLFTVGGRPFHGSFCPKNRCLPVSRFCISQIFYIL